MSETHIKHSANRGILLQIDKETIFFVKSSTPFISAVKRVQKMNHRLEKGLMIKVKGIRIKGMGKAIEKTLAIGNYFREREYKVEVFTGSEEVLDEFVGEERRYEKRMVSLVELRLTKS